MASPHAAGVAALVVAARGVPDPVNGGLTLSPAVVEGVLTRTATDKPCPGQEPFRYPFDASGAFDATCEGTPARNVFFGEGLVNAVAAGTPDPTGPAPTPGGQPGAGGATPPGTGSGGPAPGTTPVLRPRLDVAFTVARTTRVRRLTLTAAAGSRVTVTCRGGGCPRGTSTYRVGASGKRDLAARFAGRRLAKGARITILVSTPGLGTRRFVVRVRSGRAPLTTRTDA